MPLTLKHPTFSHPCPSLPTHDFPSMPLSLNTPSSPIIAHHSQLAISPQCPSPSTRHLPADTPHPQHIIFPQRPSLPTAHFPLKPSDTPHPQHVIFPQRPSLPTHHFPFKHPSRFNTTHRLPSLPLTQQTSAPNAPCFNAPSA
jgi:hypothetical protein